MIKKLLFTSIGALLCVQCSIIEKPKSSNEISTASPITNKTTSIENKGGFTTPTKKQNTSILGKETSKPIVNKDAFNTTKKGEIANLSVNKPPITQTQQTIAKPTDIAVNKTSTIDESTEYAKLMNETGKDRNQKTEKLLNQLFDNDINNKDAILLVQNKSDCNMILRIQGKNLYNLAIPSHGENSLVIKKGDYNLTSNICNSKYFSTKSINKNLMITLKYPVAKQSSSKETLPISTKKKETPRKKKATK